MSTILSVNAHSFFSTVKFIVYMRATQHQQQKSKPPTHWQQLFWYISKNINRWILILIIPVYYSYLITIYTRGMYCCCDYQLSFQLLILLLRNISQLKHHNVISMSYHEISCKSNVGIIEIYWWKSSFSNILLLLLLLLLLHFFFWEKWARGRHGVASLVSLEGKGQRKVSGNNSNRCSNWQGTCESGRYVIIAIILQCNTRKHLRTVYQYMIIIIQFRTHSR